MHAEQFHDGSWGEEGLADYSLDTEAVCVGTNLHWQLFCSDRTNTILGVCSTECSCGLASIHYSINMTEHHEWFAGCEPSTVSWESRWLSTQVLLPSIPSSSNDSTESVLFLLCEISTGGSLRLSRLFRKFAFWFNQRNRLLFQFIDRPKFRGTIWWSCE